MENGKWQRYMSIKHDKGFLKMSLGRASGGVHPRMGGFLLLLFYYYCKVHSASSQTEAEEKVICRFH